MAAAASTPAPKPRAPALYAIITIKLLKGLVLLLLAWSAYSLAPGGLLDDYKRFLEWAHLDPERKFFVNLAETIGKITPANVYWVAAGTAFYALICLTEGTGLIFRLSWAGYLAIGEGAFFIPIELYELSRKFSVAMLVVLLLNIWIVWYLFVNRHRLFRHHH